MITLGWLGLESALGLAAGCPGALGRADRLGAVGAGGGARAA